MTMQLLDLPNDVLKDIIDAAADSSISLAACGETCRRLARLSHSQRMRTFRFAANCTTGEYFPQRSERISFVSSPDVCHDVHHLSIERIATEADFQCALDNALVACDHLESLELNAFRPSEKAWSALAGSGVRRINLNAVTCSLGDDVPDGFDKLCELRVTFALPTGQQILGRCRGPLQLLSFRHFEAPDIASCFHPALWDTLVSLSLDCGISPRAQSFVDLFDTFRDHLAVSARPLPLREVHLETRRLHISGFFQIVSCLRGQPLQRLSVMVLPDLPVDFISHVADCLPTLETLRVLYNIDGLLRVTEWPTTPSQLSAALSRLPNLVDFGFNHRCFSTAVMPPRDDAFVPPLVKERIDFDLDWMHGLVNGSKSMKSITLFGLTASQLGPPSDPAFVGLDASLHYRGRAFELDDERRFSVAGDALFFPL